MDGILVSPLSHPNQNSPNQIVVYGDYLYWADTGLGTINSVPLYGGDDNVVTLYFGAEPAPPGLRWSATASIDQYRRQRQQRRDGTSTPARWPAATRRVHAGQQPGPANGPGDGRDKPLLGELRGRHDQHAPLAGESPYHSSAGRPSRTGSPWTAPSIYWTTWNWVPGTGPSGSRQRVPGPLSGEFAN